MYGHGLQEPVSRSRSSRQVPPGHLTSLSLSFTHQNPGSALIHAPTLFWAGYSGQRRTESIVVD